MKRLVLVAVAATAVGATAWVVYNILNLPDWEPI